jgi:ABC-type multidrug transport system ATPase subunit
MLAEAAPIAQALVRVEGLAKHFGGVDVFSSVGFDVRRGEILGLIGPNGSGKTTLLKCLAGLLSIDAGAVLCEQGARRSRLVFYLPDEVAPYAELFTGDVLAFFGRAYAVEPARWDRILNQLDLVPELERRVAALSKGNLKRFLLAIALLAPQPVLLLDEPFSGLDVLQTRAVMALLREARASGRTLVLAIHELGYAEQTCDRLLLLAKGQLVGAGTLPELRAGARLPEGKGNLEEVFTAWLTR